ncbi:MAG: hypothetical protein OXK77_04565 [Gemmatimonadota bacterium]|uniref:hypothetical protein n=1 Tax=Candidatus Palauibacter soopunensis TaxID=3056739 RepID=UPI0023A646A9|nr:hypothetical protein [Candidatus Palauibacter soopunensis]MDE2782209.1 hypothetical protein [Gemmatimonadota bacterium]MDE2879689.1 hypothetical protein [Candidatus Palauibacter soopunensis]
MRYRTLSPVLLVPFLLLAAPRPASAQLDFGSWVQRATIIANQITQIRNQVRELRSMASQLTELEDQLKHMERAARGEIDALLAPFSRLAAEPAGLVRDGLAWGSDFQGAARETVDAVRGFGTGGRSFTGLWRSAQNAADRVSEADILALFRDLPPGVASRAADDFRRAREAAGRQRVLDYATLDAAAALAETVESAQGSFAGLTANGNLSNTALQQAQVAAALSQGRIDAAVAQVLAHEAAREASRARLAELDRLDRLAEWRESRERANAMAVTMRDAASLNRATLRDGLRLRVPSFYR